MKTFFTSESVTEGHPDKICDQISDAVLDAVLAKDPHAHVACETTVATQLVHVFGEITTTANVDVPGIVRDVMEDIGYTEEGHGFDTHNATILVDLHKQSPDIAMGVDQGEQTGAGDQGMMFGYACDETDSYMPFAADYAHRLSHRLSEVRKEHIIEGLYPDGKTQVTVGYEDDKPVHIEAVVVSTMHSATKDMDTLRKEIVEHVIRPVLPAELFDEKTNVFINPTGQFIIGGPTGDSGLTGRKIIVDTYGGYARHGGGAFSGKDPSKVDRSAAYMARYLAKNIVASGMAKQCEIQLSYAIGVVQPLSVHVETYGTGDNEKILAEIIRREDLSPGAIIRKFDMTRPIYRNNANYGHFGTFAADMPWEKVDWNN